MAVEPGRAGSRRAGSRRAKPWLAAWSALACCVLLAAQARADTAREAFEKGVAADDGPHGRSDPSLAYHYYEIAAEQGDPDAELNLGLMNDSGVGTLADAGQAALWYARAASHGNGRAAFNLGQLYEAGEGVPQDRLLAAAWFADAAREGVDAAAPRAARLRLFGGGATASGPLEAPVPSWPSAGATALTSEVEFVWTPAGHPTPDVGYWVEIRSDGPVALPEMLHRSDVSALSVTLPSAGRYAWRVFAASPAAGAYRSSDWVHFSVSPPAAERPDTLTSR